MPEPSEDAIGAVIERQLTAFPGSSRGELARWWGVQGGAPLRKPIASLGDRVVEVVADGTKVLVCSEDVDELASIDPSTTVRLLPGFDPYTLSLQKEAEPLLPLARRPLVSRTAGWISQVVIVGGAVAAHLDPRGQEGPARDRGRALAAADEVRTGGDRRARRRGSAPSSARSRRSRSASPSSRRPT